jgi:hypothetical protein
LGILVVLISSAIIRIEIILRRRYFYDFGHSLAEKSWREDGDEEETAIRYAGKLLGCEGLHGIL